jgi:hypothetical protein
MVGALTGAQARRQDSHLHARTAGFLSALQIRKN